MWAIFINLGKNARLWFAAAKNPYQWGCFGVSSGEVLWNKMKQNLKNYLNAHGGCAIVNTNNLYRPDWNKVKDVLMGVKPISVLGCE